MTIRVVCEEHDIENALGIEFDNKVNNSSGGSCERLLRKAIEALLPLCGVARSIQREGNESNEWERMLGAWSIGNIRSGWGRTSNIGYRSDKTSWYE